MQSLDLAIQQEQNGSKIINAGGGQVLTDGFAKRVSHKAFVGEIARKVPFETAFSLKSKAFRAKVGRLPYRLNACTIHQLICNHYAFMNPKL